VGERMIVQVYARIYERLCVQVCDSKRHMANERVDERICSCMSERLSVSLSDCASE